ncbi:MAG: transporter substrate-binding domain-containing protein [Lacunisphaera sp.]
MSPLPWNDVLDQFKAGKIDIICNLVDTPERRNYIDFSATTVFLHGAAYTRKDAPPLRTIADLQGRHVATLRKSRGHEYLRHQNWGVSFVYFDNMLLSVDAVHEGRADMFVGTRMVADYQLHQRGYTDIVLAPLELPGFDFREHFGVHPGQAELLAKLNEGLLTIQRDGTYDRLYEKWIGPIQIRTLRWRDIQPYALPMIVLLTAVLAGLAWQRRVLARVRRQAEALRQSEEQLSPGDRRQPGRFLGLGRAHRRRHAQPALGRDAGLQPRRGDRLARRLPEPHSSGRPGASRGGRIFRVERTRPLPDGIPPAGALGRMEMDPRPRQGRRPQPGHRRTVAHRRARTPTSRHASWPSRRMRSSTARCSRRRSSRASACSPAASRTISTTCSRSSWGNASLSRLEPGIRDGEKARLTTIVTAAKRAADLCAVARLRGQGRLRHRTPRLNRVARETARLLELSVHTCTLEFNLAPDLPAIEADPSQIRQIIMNLVLNAAEAAGARPGRIRVVTAAVTLRDGDLPDALPAGTHLAGSFVQLEIGDDGAGMMPDVRRRIFDPFFTTKFAGRGLGLAAVLGIVRSHGGALTVQSEAGAAPYSASICRPSMACQRSQFPRPPPRPPRPARARC